jgi:hypothetical protein
MTALAMISSDCATPAQIIARGFVEAPTEMPAALRWAARVGLDLSYDPRSLTGQLAISGPATADDEPDEAYLITADFDQYRLLPPIWKFVHPHTREDIGPGAYPRPVGPSALHGQGLVCAHWNRMAYAEHGGPHGEWGGPSSWQQPVTGTVALTIPDMLDRLVREVSWSRGRMAPLPS